MTSCGFLPGERVAIDSVSYHLRRKLADKGWQLENSRDGELVVITEAGLRELYSANRLNFQIHGEGGEGVVEEVVQEKIAKNFGDYPEQMQKEAKRRLDYVRAFQAAGKKDLRNALIMVAEKVGDKKPPSLASLHRWARHFKDSSRDICSLIPGFFGRGNRKARYSEEVADIVMEELRRLYLFSQRYSLDETLSAARNAIEQENRSRPSSRMLPKPGRKFLRNMVESIDAYERMRARLGKAVADRYFRAALESGEKVSEPLARVEIDHTVLDLIVVHPNTYLPLGRPTITVALDRCTRCVLGYYVSFEPPSYLQVMKCLAHAIKPKDYMQTKYPEVRNNWPCWGIPQQIVVDNGREFHSKDFEKAAMSLLIDVRYGPVAQPWWKGAVERFFRTVSKSLIHTLPGATFSKPEDRGDYDSKKKAAVTLDVLNELLHTWICDVYHQTRHRSLLSAPISVWRDLIDPVNQKLPPSAEELDVQLASVETRTVFHYGVSLHSMNYNSQELQALRRRQGNIKVTVRWDRSDLGYIHVLDESTNRYLKVPCTWFEYASGTGLWLHNRIQREAESRDGGYSEANLDEAKARIRQLCQKAFTHQRLSKRKEAARAEPGLAERSLGLKAEQLRLDEPDSVPQPSLERAKKRPAWGVDDGEDEIREFQVTG